MSSVHFGPQSSGASVPNFLVPKTCSRPELKYLNGLNRDARGHENVSRIQTDAPNVHLFIILFYTFLHHFWIKPTFNRYFCRKLYLSELLSSKRKCSYADLSLLKYLCLPTAIMMMITFYMQMVVAGEAKMCKWMHEHQVDWIHKAPALAGMALNLFFLIRIMWVSWIQPYFCSVRSWFFITYG